MKVLNNKVIFLILITSFSCKQGKDVIVSTPIITNTFKIEFLNEILSDKSNHYIYAYNHSNPYIKYRSYDFDPNIIDITFKDSLGNPTSFAKYLDVYFKDNDSAFIKSQFENNKTFSINPLKKYGYNVLDWKTIYNDTLKTNDGYLISRDSLEKLSNDKFEKGEFEISNLLFNKSLNMAYIEIHYFMSHRNHILYHNIDGKWLVKGRISYVVY